MKVEMTVDWGALSKEPRPAPRLGVRYPKIPTSRTERRLYFIALARHIEDQIKTGQADSLVQIAKLCCVSRARVSQLMG